MYLEYKCYKPRIIVYWIRRKNAFFEQQTYTSCQMNLREAWNIFVINFDHMFTNYRVGETPVYESLLQHKNTEPTQ